MSRPTPVPTEEIAGPPAGGQDDLAPLLDAMRRLFLWSFRIGAALLALGVALALLRGEPLPTEAAPFRALVPALRAGHAEGVVDLAILWFMATPVVAVVVVGAGFWRRGDRRYAAVCGLVLVILGVSIALAGRR